MGGRRRQRRRFNIRVPVSGGGGGVSCPPRDQGVIAVSMRPGCRLAYRIYCSELRRNRHHLEVKWPRVVENLNEPGGARVMAMLLGTN